MQEVYNFLNSLNINKNDTLIVGVSYGPDSMFLLYLLKTYFKDNRVVCAHVHHNHRKESDEEEKELKKYCIDNDIIFEYMKIESYTNDKFTEEEARSKRYEFFEELLRKYNSKYLFTAHHGDDLIETVLMRLVRGSSINGYAAISLVSNRDNYKLVRPLLYLTKDDILKECKENNIPFAIDITNLSDEQTRNRYRNNVLPFLKKENKGVHKKFLDFSSKLKEYNDFVNMYVDDIFERIVSDNIIDINKLLNEKDLIIKKVLEKFLYFNYGNDIKLISDKNVDLIIKMMKSNKSNDVIIMPKKKSIIKSYNKLYFDNNTEYNDYCMLLDDYTLLPNNYVIRRVDKRDNNSNYITLLNSKEIKMPLYVRNRLDGDKIEILNMSGSKKVKDIFIDEKIDKTLRKNYPVVVDSNGTILWIPGIKKSKYDKSKKGNYDIILKYDKEVYNESK